MWSAPARLRDRRHHGLRLARADRRAAPHAASRHRGPHRAAAEGDTVRIGAPPPSPWLGGLDPARLRRLGRAPGQATGAGTWGPDYLDLTARAYRRGACAGTARRSLDRQYERPTWSGCWRSSVDGMISDRPGRAARAARGARARRCRRRAGRAHEMSRREHPRHRRQPRGDSRAAGRRGRLSRPGRATRGPREPRGGQLRHRPAGGRRGALAGARASAPTTAWRSPARRSTSMTAARTSSGRSSWRERSSQRGCRSSAAAGACRWR